MFVSASFSLENNAYSFGRTTIANLKSGYVWAGVGWVIEILRGCFVNVHLLQSLISFRLYFCPCCEATVPAPIFRLSSWNLVVGHLCAMLIHSWPQCLQGLTSHTQTCSSNLALTFVVSLVTGITCCGCTPPLLSCTCC